MSTLDIEPSPELIAAITRNIFLQLRSMPRPDQEPDLDPDITSSLEGSSSSELPSSEPPRLSSDDERLSAMEDSIRVLLERTSHTNGDADDEGDGGSCRTNLGYILGGRYRDLKSDQKAAQNELARQIRQIMKALTKRAGAQIDEDDDDDDDQSIISPTERGFRPDYGKPPKYETNESLIRRTVEILLGQYELNESTGHYTCEGVLFNKKDCYFLATTFFENKKRAYQISKSSEKKKRYERAKRNNRRHLRQRQTKEKRATQVEAYLTKYHVELPDEVFQSDLMTELVSGLDSSEISSPSSAESADEGDEIVPKSLVRAEHVKARRADYYACLAAHASLTSTERRRKVKLWEERKSACRSKKLDRIYKRLDKLMDKEQEEDTKGVRMWARRVSLGNKTIRIPRCKKAIWPFMVDQAWLDDDEDFRKAAWTKLQQADPAGLDLQINTDSQSSD
ncbi:hypothetical protein ACEPAF_2581 [Sanghuangporus sanghuang]